MVGHERRVDLKVREGVEGGGGHGEGCEDVGLGVSLEGLRG